MYCPTANRECRTLDHMHGPCAVCPLDRSAPRPKARCYMCNAVLIVGEECMPEDLSGLCNRCFSADDEPYPVPGPSLCGEGAVSIDEWVLYHAPEE